ncbi:hypothetical protein AtNW77_Chr4g0284661 [Arabidopsis thaliana]
MSMCAWVLFGSFYGVVVIELNLALMIVAFLRMVSFSIPAIRKSVDRSLRDRLLSLPSLVPPSSSLSLLAFYFGCIHFV